MLVRSFLAVLDAGSLLAASKRLQLAQPTLGRHIDALEAQLAANLFERTGRGLRPTAAALAIVDHARSMEAGASALRRAISRISGELAGSVRVTTSRAAAAYLLPDLIARFRDANPEIQIELVASDEVKNLLRREADIAVRMTRPTQTGLIARRLGAAPLGAFAHRGYLKRAGTPRVPLDLLGHALVGYDTDDAMLRAFRSRGAAIGKDAFVLRSDDVVVQWQAIRAGLGIGFTTTYVAATDPEVVRVLPDLALPPLPIWLICHREIRNSPRIRRIFDFLAETIPQRAG